MECSLVCTPRTVAADHALAVDLCYHHHQHTHVKLNACGLGEPGDISPPKANADVFDAPALPKFFLAVPILFGVVDQLDPFQDSVVVKFVVDGEFPAKAKAEVDVPAPPKPSLPVFKVFFTVQLDPLYNSV